MKEKFKDSTIGALSVSAFLLILTGIIALFSEIVTPEFILIVPLYYFIVSIVFYGCLSFSRSQLARDELFFIGATIFATGGGWWILHAFAFLNVKINEGVYKKFVSLFDNKFA